jgi:WD40 repeat protein
MPFEINIKVPARGDGVRRRYALTVGIDRYDDPALRLPFCVADATRLAATLTARGYHVTELRDPRAPALRRALRDLVRGADADDVILFYFSGHGRLLGDKPYLLFADTPNTDLGIAKRGVPLCDVLGTLRGAPRWVGVFLDACRMGLGLEPEVGRSTTHSAQRDGAFALLSGSTTGQIAQDTESAGIFSAKLLEGLRGAAADADGAVRFSALAYHVQRGVAEWRDSPEGRAKLAAQTPVLRLEVSDFVILPPNEVHELSPSLPQKIRAAAFSPDGRRLATACEDGSVRFWDPATRTQVLETMWHQGHASGVAFSPDGILLASTSNDGTCRIWQVPGANEVTPGPAPLLAIVNAAAWSPDGRLLATAAGDGVHVYDVGSLGRTGGGERVLAGHAGTVWAVAFLPDGRLVSGGADHTVRVWDLEAGTCTAELLHDGPVWAIAVSPDGRRLAAGGTDDRPGDKLVNVPRIWDLAKRKILQRLVGHRGGVTAVAFSPGGEQLATASYDGRARLWRVKDGAPLRELALDAAVRSHPAEAYAAAFSPDGARLFVGFADGRGGIFELAPRRD